MVSKDDWQILAHFELTTAEREISEVEQEGLQQQTDAGLARGVQSIRRNPWERYHEFWPFSVTWSQFWRTTSALHCRLSARYFPDKRQRGPMEACQHPLG